MAWVAVDKDGDENIYDVKPIREKEFWDVTDRDDSSIKLPKGSIAKLIGHELAWGDEPVELIETKEIRG